MNDILEYLDLPTAPPKASDNRAFEGETCQAEAIPPDVLATIVTDAVEERTDLVALNAVKATELKIRKELEGRSS